MRSSRKGKDLTMFLKKLYILEQECGSPGLAEDTIYERALARIAATSSTSEAENVRRRVSRALHRNPPTRADLRAAVAHELRSFRTNAENRQTEQERKSQSIERETAAPTKNGAEEERQVPQRKRLRDADADENEKASGMGGFWTR